MNIVFIWSCFNFCWCNSLKNIGSKKKWKSHIFLMSTVLRDSVWICFLLQIKSACKLISPLCCGLTGFELWLLLNSQKSAVSYDFSMQYIQMWHQCSNFYLVLQLMTVLCHTKWFYLQQDVHSWVKYLFFDLFLWRYFSGI